jgi:outer membrane protein assembly factor BamE (lipoprotein component of BamABCDE complex)
MHRLAITLVLAATLGLQACVVAVDRDDDTDWRGTDWRETQERNRDAIARLDLGISQDEVISRLGAPDSSEAFSDGRFEYRLYFYRTRHRYSDGETTRDETTPLLFRDGALVGWGDEVMHEFRLRLRDSSL